MRRDQGSTGVTIQWLVVVLSLGSALSFAISTTLKHRSAELVPDVASVRSRALGRFVRDTLRHPLWLGGLIADIVGLALQITALHLGALAVVQPLLLSGLVFSLALRRRHGRSISPKEIGWALVVTACLIGLLLLSGSISAATTRHPADRLPAVIGAFVGLVVVVGFFAVGRRRRPMLHGAAFIGVAVGTVYAASAALLKGLSDIAVRHPFAILWSWQLYAVVVVGAAGVVASQLAFQAGPLTASLPAIATVDPLVSVLIGVMIFDERLHAGPWSGPIMGVLLVLLVVAVIRLVKLEQRDPELVAVE